MELPVDAEGAVRVTLTESHLDDNGLSALWIEDQAGATGTIASRASIRLSVEGGSMSGNGFAGEDEAFADFDGIRVNEGGDGWIELFVSGTAFDENAGEGIELDEQGSGDVRARIQDASFDRLDEDGRGSIQLQLVDVEASRNLDEKIKASSFSARPRSPEMATTPSMPTE